MSITGIGAAAAYSYFPSTTQSKSAAALPVPSTDTGLTAAEQAFLKYQRETPAQKLEDAWLKAHHLTREQLAAMPPAQREAIEKQMAADLKEKLKQQAVDQANKKAGGATDITV